MTAGHTRSRRFLFGVVVPLLLLALTACLGGSRSSLNPAPTPGATGRLAVNSEPDKAEIYLDGKPTGKTTPAELSGLAPGTYELTVAKDGRKITTMVRVQQGQTIPLMLHMNSETVEGRVIFGRSGPPVRGSNIEAWDEHYTNIVAQAISDEDGAFTLPLPPGRYHIIASQPDTLSVGAAQDVEVPTSMPVEIIQRELFADGPTANPQVLSIEVSGLEPGDIVSSHRELIIDVHGENASLIRYIGARVGHQDPRPTMAQSVQDQQTMLFALNPGLYGPGDTYLHVAAYDVQLNVAQLIIPFTIPPHAADGEPLPAPTGLRAESFSFLAQPKLFSVDEMNAFMDSLEDLGMTPLPVTAQSIPPYNKWIHLMWEPVPDAFGYRIYRRTASSYEGTIVADVSAHVHPPQPIDSRSLHSFVDASAFLKPGTSYYYSIRAYDEAGQMSPATEEVLIFVLEPFEAELLEPADESTVIGTPLLRWSGTRLPPLPGYEYEYVYEIGISGETSGNLTDPEFRTRADNQEAIQAPPGLIPGRSYQWDLIAAYAKVDISDASQAVSFSGKYAWPNLQPPYSALPGLRPLGSSVNGAYRFVLQATP